MKKIFKTLNSIILSVLFTVFGLYTVKATNPHYELNSECTITECEPESMVPIDIKLVYSKQACIKLKPFTCKITFDPNVLEFYKVNKDSEINLRNFSIDQTNNEVFLIYNPQHTWDIKNSESCPCLFKFNFKVKAQPKSTTTSLNVDILKSDFKEPLSSNIFKLNITNNSECSYSHKDTAASNSLTANSQNCKLKFLIPNDGILTPNFKPDVFNYKVTVPYEVQDLYFETQAFSSNTQIVTNRHKLNAPGRPTIIELETHNGNQTCLYTVEVIRCSKPTKFQESGLSSDLCDDNSDNKHRKNKRSNHTRNPKTKNGQIDSDDLNDEDLIENDDNDNNYEENPSIKNNSENDLNITSNSKLYFIIVSCIIALAIISYFLIKFIKTKKKSNKNINNPINKSFKK